MSAPKSRPVHPCVLTTTDACRGCELSTWARLIPGRPHHQLVTASASTIAIYSLYGSKLFCHYQFGNLAGNVIHLSALEGHDSEDALLVGFSGQARLSVVTLQHGLLRAEALLDLQPAWEASAFGAASYEDAKTAVTMTSPGFATVACVLGGGTAVCCANIHHVKKLNAWIVENEPYILPLTTLSKDLPHVEHPEVVPLVQVCTGFGQIQDVIFWRGYQEPVVVLLHSGVNGRVNSGRLGREVDGDNDPGATSMYCTALSISVSHTRAALLWSAPVPADAQYMSCSPKSQLCVISVNSIAMFQPGGKVESHIATNGWARATCPGSLQTKLEANPLLKLALSLEDCRMGWLSKETALLSLRNGQLYVLQHVDDTWTLWPTGQTLGAIGQVEHLTSRGTGDKQGILFCGSRLGDSVLLKYQLEETSMPWQSLSVASPESVDGLLKLPSLVTAEAEKLLEQEEAELYGNSTLADNGPAAENASKKTRLATFSRVSALETIDSLTNLGPLGKGILGPVTPPPGFLQEHDPVPVAGLEKEPVWGSPVLLHPCGYGSSGGVAIGAVPGRDDRYLRFEVDVVNVNSLFAIQDTVLLAMPVGMMVLKHDSKNLTQIELQDWLSSSDDADLFSESVLLQAAEFTDDSFMLLLQDRDKAYRVVVMKGSTGGVAMTHQIGVAGGKTVVSCTPIAHFPKSTDLGFAYTTSDGNCEAVRISLKGTVKVIDFSGDLEAEDDPMELEEDDKEKKDVKAYYACRQVVAADVFTAPKKLFANVEEDLKMDETVSNDVDEELEELYTVVENPVESSGFETISLSQDHDVLGEEHAIFVAVCRQSGDLEVYSFDARKNKKPVWQSKGCGQGVPGLSQEMTARTPRTHKVHAKEIRFFTCGATCEDKDSELRNTRDFYLAVLSSSGDLSLYRRAPSRKDGFCLELVRRKSVARASQHQTRHRTKLIRKKMASAGGGEESFQINRLLPFSGISGQDGLFVATVRPFWVCGDRGHPVVLFHRTRHAAPSGGKPYPLSGFCFSRRMGGAFMALHERVGRVGSQRLTIFDGLTKAFDSNGVLPGAGMAVEKVTLGVTVRSMYYIDDPQVSSPDHPMYLVLVSKEVDEDQGDLNDDGKTEEERQEELQKKEEAKIKRQVEADLGGFDLEKEWVEEIERDDCFDVDTNLGGASPIRKESYAVWIVDAARSWAILDSFELEENEHGLTVNTMYLTEFPDDGANSNSETQIDEDRLPKRLFVALGTGILDHNGEDVASKGRALLLELKAANVAGQTGVELSLRYEKPIFHGPVTTLVCLSSEGKNRLLIGAGADGELDLLTF